MISKKKKQEIVVEHLKKALDDGAFGAGVAVDLEAFATFMLEIIDEVEKAGKRSK